MTNLMYLLIFILITILILAMTGKKSVHHEIKIDAPIDKVWSVLLDTESYLEWNTVMKLLEGDVVEGETVKYQFTQDEDNISEIASKVIKVIPKRLLNQAGGVPLVITFNHKYILNEVGDSTSLTIHEDYAGLYVHFWNPKDVELAYARLNSNIKSRIEK